MARAVVVAAGSGRRFGGDKLFRPLHGQPVLARALRPCLSHPRIDGVVLVVAAAKLERARERLEPYLPAPAPPLAVVAGGATRQESVWCGLRHLEEEGLAADELVLVHDGARPFASRRLVDRVLAAASRYGAAVPVLPPAETIKLLGKEGRVESTFPRHRLGAAQTPQGFRFAELLRAHRLAREAAGPGATDDAALLEEAGSPVRAVEGELENIKLTHRLDWALALELAGTAEDRRAGEKGGGAMRIGYGYDLHPLAPGRKLVLGGVEIPWELGLAGHSDADVLCHAIADALLGAAGLPDIGHHFPPDDPTYEDADSVQLLARVRELVEAEGYRVVNVDATVVAQAPSLAPHREAVIRRLSGVLELPASRLSVKATTHEGLGPLGRGEAVAVHAVAMLTEG